MSSNGHRARPYFVATPKGGQLHKAKESRGSSLAAQGCPQEAAVGPRTSSACALKRSALQAMRAHSLPIQANSQLLPRNRICRTKVVMDRIQR